MFITINQERESYGSVYHTQEDCKILKGLRESVAVRISPKELRILNKTGKANITTKCEHCKAISRRLDFEARCQKEIAKVEAAFAAGDKQCCIVFSDTNKTMLEQIREKGWRCTPGAMIRYGLYYWEIRQPKG